MAIIVAIGGGEIGQKETYLIDEHIVKLANRRKANVLFIPTASGEPEGYISTVRQIYADALGCNYDWLSLQTDTPDRAALERKIDWADILYVGGGNTRMMMQVWARHGLDQVLRANFSKDKVYSGLSAGSICWFASGLSDSDSFEAAGAWSYSYVDGLGLINGCHCPHYDERLREPNFNDFLQSLDRTVLAIENNCALVLDGENYTIVRSQPDKHAYWLGRAVYGTPQQVRLEDHGSLSRRVF